MGRGLRLSAMRMEGTEHPTDFVSELAFGQGSIGEYLMAEVLDRQPGHVRRLLVETRFLDEVTGALADAVTGRWQWRGARRTCTEELFCRPAGRSPYQVPLPRAICRDPSIPAAAARALSRPMLYRRASAWFEDQGDLLTALRWAIRAGDQRHAVSLLARGVVAQVLVRGQAVAEAELRELLPLSVPEDADAICTAEIATARSVIAALTADGDVAARELASIEPNVPVATPGDPALEISAELSALILAQKAGDTQAIDAIAQRLTATEGPGSLESIPGLGARVQLARVQAHFWDGQHDDVDTQLHDALASAEHDELSAVELEVLGMLALVDSYRSRTAHADDAAQRARELLHATPELTSPFTLELATAWRAFIQADFQTMAAVIRTAIATGQTDADRALATLLAQLRAHMLLGSGQVSAAKAVLDAVPMPCRGAAMLQASRTCCSPTSTPRWTVHMRHCDCSAATAMARSRVWPPFPRRRRISPSVIWQRPELRPAGPDRARAGRPLHGDRRNAV